MNLEEHLINVRFYAQVAQLVEQRTENPRVGGSIPPLGTTFPLEIWGFLKFLSSLKTSLLS